MCKKSLNGLKNSITAYKKASSFVGVGPCSPNLVTIGAKLFFKNKAKKVIVDNILCYEGCYCLKVCVPFDELVAFIGRLYPSFGIDVSCD